MRLLAAVPRDASPRRLFLTPFVVTVLVGCSHAPPEGFAPDPGLVSQIKDIRIMTAYARACPGSALPTNYEAVLADGSRVPFSRSYDKKHPPRLHVVFLDRSSAEATSQQDGDWVTDGNALATAATGFRLTATLRAKPGVTVRLAILRSPFYDKLFVAGVQVGLAPPFYVLQDASVVPPADWLVIESRGGRGGSGVAGTRGAD